MKEKAFAFTPGNVEVGGILKSRSAGVVILLDTVKENSEKLWIRKKSESH